jgi:putative ABC transport system substrate-binding protein
MKRTTLFVSLVLVLLAAPLAAEAQQTGKVWRIGLLMLGDRPGAMKALVEGLRELNYVEGRNLILEHRRAARNDQLPTLATELVRFNPHVIVAGSGRAASALKAATKTVPIVMASSGDAIAQGLVASLARPGGNVTGFTNISTELAAKRLEILKEGAPRAVRIGVVGCQEESPVSKRQWSEVQPAAQRLGLRLVPIFVRQPEELSGAFERAMRQKIEAVLVFDCTILPRVEDVTGLVNRSRVPAMYPVPRYVQVGGLMSYGPDPTDQYRRAAVFVDKILKGAKPADLPVEQPTKFELVINLKTAKALGLTIPPSVLVRADHVIE